MRLIFLFCILLFSVSLFGQGEIKYIHGIHNDTLIANDIAIDDEYVYAFIRGKQKPNKIPRTSVTYIDYNDPILTQDGPNIYVNRVVEAPGASKEQIYKAARIWVTDAYKNAEAVLQMDDLELGTMVIKGTIRITDSYSGIGEDLYGNTLHHTLRIDVKEGKLRFILNNIEFENPQAFQKSIWSSYKYFDSDADALFFQRLPDGKRPSNNFYKLFNVQLRGILVSLVEGLNQYIETNDDW